MSSSAAPASTRTHARSFVSCVPARRCARFQPPCWTNTARPAAPAGARRANGPTPPVDEHRYGGYGLGDGRAAALRGCSSPRSPHASICGSRTARPSRLSQPRSPSITTSRRSDPPFEAVIDSATGVGKTYILAGAMELFAAAYGRPRLRHCHPRADDPGEDPGQLHAGSPQVPARADELPARRHHVGQLCHPSNALRHGRRHRRSRCTSSPCSP